MAKSKCLNSARIPAARVDADGFCEEHGWDCDDYGISLEEQRLHEKEEERRQ